MATAIPLFDGVRPYQQVPFQYSLHSRGKKKGRLSHSEYIALPGKDPRKELLIKLLKEIPENACVITYTDFEEKWLHELAQWFPRYQKKIKRIIDNIRDISHPFKQKDYYHWKMSGSYSIKKVLPTLVPDMGYDAMEINNGQMAVDAYLKMSSSSEEKEVSRIRKNLSEYCCLDTLAMVRILEKLELVQEAYMKIKPFKLLPRKL